MLAVQFHLLDLLATFTQPHIYDRSIVIDALSAL
jgi:hypothetical protein